jgi:hypothetical protein
VLLVFWTRYAAQSDYVRQEYERFATQFPHRRLVPVRGDTTPLPPRLQVRHYSDFCPVLNDLLDMVRNLEANGASRRQIRAAVLQRLKEEGIELRRGERRRLLGLFGISTGVLAPLYVLVDQRNYLVDFLRRQRDRLLDRTAAVADKLTALPAAYYYTAGVAITAGFLTCHGAARGLDTIAYKKGHEAAQVAALSEREAAIDAEVKARVAQEIAQARRELQDTFEERVMDRYRELAPALSPVDVRLNQSGTDACKAEKMICVSMSRTRIHERRSNKFFGFSTPPCSARVIREPICPPETDYAMKGVVLERSPEADPGVSDFSGNDYFCLTKEKGKQGIFQSANCVKP